MAYVTLSGLTGPPFWELVFNHHTIGLWLVLGSFVIWLLVRQLRSENRGAAAGEDPSRSAGTRPGRRDGDARGEEGGR